MYRRILVPLDGTRFGDQALPHAVEIAVRTGASVELVHVHHYVERNGSLSAMPQYQYQHVREADEQFDDRAAAAEQRQLEAKAAAIEQLHGVRVTTRVLNGRTHEAIVEEAGNVVADLIVLATHARTGLARLRYGSLAQTLVGQLNVPALCVHPTVDGTAEGQISETPAALDRVLVALDGSAFSEQILDAAAPLLTALRAKVTLIHVVSPRPFFLTGVDDTHRAIVHREQALDYLHDVARRWRGRIPDPLLLAVEDAQPANLIAHLLRSGEYDAVAMATHGRGGLSALITGSVSSAVLEATHSPVLLYRPRLVALPDPDLEASLRLSGDGPATKEA